MKEIDEKELEQASGGYDIPEGQTVHGAFDCCASYKNVLEEQAIATYEEAKKSMPSWFSAKCPEFSNQCQFCDNAYWIDGTGIYVCKLGM